MKTASFMLLSSNENFFKLNDFPHYLKILIVESISYVSATFCTASNMKFFI